MKSRGFKTWRKLKGSGRNKRSWSESEWNGNKKPSERRLRRNRREGDLRRRRLLKLRGSKSCRKQKKKSR